MPIPKINPELENLTIDIDQLVLDSENARTHGPDSIAAMKKSLEAFGQQRPVVYWKNRDRRGFVVIAGNATAAAAKELGWNFVAGVRFDSEFERSEAEARKYALADNRTAEGTRGGFSPEVWDKIKEAVSMAMSADCECDGGPAECVPCRGWSEVQAAMVSGEHRKEKTNSDKYRVSQGPRSGLAAIIGKWPGGETDDEIADALGKSVEGDEIIERMKIVAWIRDQPHQHANGLADIADAIERGDHRRNEE